MNLETYYLLDTVSLSKLTTAQLTSSFVRRNCRIPEEIIYECRDSPKLNMMMELVYPVSVQILGRVADILAGFSIDEKILDLYQYEGNGDLALLAIAMHELAKNSGLLIGSDWIIVTDDEGLAVMAAKYGVTAISTQQFKEVI